MTWWSWLFFGAIIAGAVVILSWGARGFNTTRARATKHGEKIDDRGFQEHVVLVARTHPEVVRTARLDRHPFYLAAYMCVLGYAVCVFGGAKLTSNVTALGGNTRTTMGWTFLVGSLIVLAASALGGRIFGKTIKSSVRDHPTWDALGDDISLPYGLASAGMAIVAVGAGIYSWTSFTSTSGTPASLGGWLSGGVVALGSGITMVLMRVRSRFFEKWDVTLIAEAQARIGAGDDAGR